MRSGAQSMQLGGPTGGGEAPVGQLRAADGTQLHGPVQAWGSSQELPAVSLFGSYTAPMRKQ